MGEEITKNWRMDEAKKSQESTVNTYIQNSTGGSLSFFCSP